MRAARAAAALGPLLLLAACGDLPQPFAGKPGGAARLLLQPPPPRLAVPAPTDALLPDAAARPYADAVATALVAREVPAVAGPAHPGDWRLVLSAELQGTAVTPRFTVFDPQGKQSGQTDGPPVAAADWNAAAPAVLRQEAVASAGAISNLLSSIDAARKRTDPNSLYNRPPRVFVAPVTGAPGDGNRSLVLELRRLLPQQGEQLQDSPQGADFTVVGTVHTSPAPGDQTRVEIQWHITDAAGHDLGKVVQLNDVPKGTLDGLWADVALVVAQQAAAGVKDVIDKQTGGHHAADHPAAPPAQTGHAPAAP